MTHPKPQDGDSIAGLIEDDLAALREVSARDPGSVNETLRAAIDRRAASKGWLAMMLQPKKTRRRLLVAAFTFAACAFMLVVPLPYHRVVGHDLALRFGGKLDAQQARAVAKRLEHALGVKHARLESKPGVQAGYLFRASLTERSRKLVDREVAGVVSGLRTQGLQVDAPVISTRTERASGTVYAQAREQLTLHVSIVDRTPEQIQADLEAQLAAALVDDSVQVKQSPSGDLSIAIQGSADPNDADLDFVFDGVEFDQVKRVELPAGVTPQQIADTVRAQLAAQGVTDMVVSVDANGKVSVTPASK